MTPAAARPTLRIARRNVMRSPWRSLLVGLLVLLPVAGMVAAIALIETTTPSIERQLVSSMGRADAIANMLPGEQPPSDAELGGLLPPGSRFERIANAEGRLALPGRTVSVSLRSFDLDGLARGMLDVVAGRAPQGGDEVAVTRSVQALAGGVGSTLTLQGTGQRRIVGIVEDPLRLDAEVVVESPVGARAAAPDSGEGVSWLIDLPAGAVIDATLQAPGSDRPLVFVNTRSEHPQIGDERGPAFIVLGGLALVEAALIAAAAFAVGVRRRQRELGLLAASGATPADLAATVLAEGFVVGGLAALAGVAAGLAAAVATSPWLDALTNQRNPPVGIDPRWAVAAAVIGVAAALAAAAVPAWTAARVPVLAALSGRRPPGSPAHRTLALGVALVAVAVALTSLGAARNREGDGIAIPLLLAGAVVGTLGFGACSPWLLERFGRPAARLPLSIRIAFRDTARARSRSGPIVTALLAGFAATVALSAYLASQAASEAAQWRPWLLADQVYLQGDGVDAAGHDVATALGAIAAAPVTYPGTSDRDVCVIPAGQTECAFRGISAGSADLLRALGAGDAVADFDRGAVVLLSPSALRMETVRVRLADSASGAVLASVDAPARAVEVAVGGMGLPEAVVPPQILSRLGAAPGPPRAFIMRLSHSVTAGDLAAAQSIASRYPGTFADASIPPDTGWSGFRMAMLLASLLFALAVTGIAVALGEAESRPDQKTLLALGAEPSLRRRIAAARAGVLTVLGGALAVPAGLLPVWGLLASRGAPLVVPLPEVLGALVALPLLAMAITFVASRPIPDWSALRTARG